MRALSLRQPWAWLVVHGGKLIENRRWNTSFRGRFLIHAAKGCTEDEYLDAEFFRASRFGLDTGPELPAWKALKRGGIVGVATLDGVLRPGEVDHAALLANRSDVDVRWHMQEQYGFVLRDVAPLAFTPMRGALGFFDVDPLAAAELLRSDVPK